MENQFFMEDSVNLSELVKIKKTKRVNSRTKGNTFERKVAGILNEHFKTTEFCRSPGSGAFATVHKLPEHLNLGGDLLTPKDFPYLIECKKGYDFKVADLFNPKSKFMEIIEKLEVEALRHKKSPLLIFQQDRQNILVVKASFASIIPPQNRVELMYCSKVVMTLDDFLKFYCTP